MTVRLLPGKRVPDTPWLDKAGLAGASLRSMNIQALYFWRFTDKGRQKNNDQVI
jgi:hypothetical protein